MNKKNTNLLFIVVLSLTGIIYMTGCGAVLNNKENNYDLTPMVMIDGKLYYPLGHGYVDENHDFAKFLYQYNRHDLLEFIALSKLNIMLSLDNLIYIVYFTNKDKNTNIYNAKLEETVPLNIQKDNTK